MKRISPLLKVIVFSLLFFSLLSKIQFPLLHGDRRIYHMVKGFYQEERNSLDAVYIGASSTYAFFQAPLVWHEFGFTIRPFATPPLPFSATKYIIEETKRTQPNSLYIITLNGLRNLENRELFRQKFTNGFFHQLIDFIPFSINKIKMVSHLCNILEIPLLSQLEFYFPIIRLHSKWSRLTSSDFVVPLEQLKGGQHYKEILKYSVDVSSQLIANDSSLPSSFSSMTEIQTKELDDLLDYLDRQKINVLFVLSPMIGLSASDHTLFNEAAAIINERGYPVLDTLDSIEEIGFDPVRDYYNDTHTNIHGAIKYMQYLGKYISEHYDFKDKRGDPLFADWDSAYEKYQKIIEPYVLDFEFEFAPRDVSLPAPKLNNLTTEENGFSLSWTGVPDADGYVIYRKSVNEKWEAIHDVDSHITAIEDNGLMEKTEYHYTVVPYINKNGIRTYGRFDYTGISGKTWKKQSKLSCPRALHKRMPVCIAALLANEYKRYGFA